MRVDTVKLKDISLKIKNAGSRLAECKTADELRGVEGEAAKWYFSAMDDLILQQKKDFFLNNRNRRPPMDNMNALLSFVYTLLANNCAAALEAVGLDPYVGFLHRDRPGRSSLALDLMEEFRAVLADRFVLSIVNKRIVTPSGFTRRENGSVIMTDDTRRAVITAWQNKKAEEIKHPFLDEKIEWGLVPYSQALLLSRFIRGDIDAYPPFFWK